VIAGLRWIRSHPTLSAGAIITLLLVAVGLLSLVWTPEPPTRVRITLRLRGPLEAGLLGTDHFGRDVLSLVMAGASNSLAIAVPSVLLGLAGGVALGAAAAAARGWFEEIAMRAADVAFAFPAVLSAIMIGALIGSGPTTAVIAIAVFNVPVFARVTRGAALQIWARDYILAARAAGKGPLRITGEHILPNIASVLIVQATIQLALAILAEAGLSFLGLGVRPPNPSWGRMLADAQTFLAQAPHLALVPGCAIALSVLGLNLLGDGLRDALDPKLGREASPALGERGAKAAAPAPGEATEKRERTQAALLEVQSLRVTVPAPSGRVPVVDGVGFALRPGGTLGIVGESGSGKSMLALAIMGLLPDGAAASGRVLLDGRDLLALDEPALCRVRGGQIGMIFQEPMTALNPAMRVGDQIAEGLVWQLGLGRAEARRRSVELIERVRIPEARRRAASYPHELSGGQRQRIGIAIALALRPRLLIADEPTTALDTTVQSEILDLLAELISELDMALVLISHDLGVVASLAERTLVMYAGTAVELGDTREVLARPAHPYARALLGAVPGRARGRLVAIPGSVPAPGSLPPGCRFSDRCAFAVEACRSGEPDLRPVLDQRLARCIRVEEIVA